MKLLARLFSKAPPSPPTLQERIAILNAGSADLILDAALHAEEESMRVAAQTRVAQLIDDGSIHDPAQLAQLVVESPSSRLRQLAAELVHDPAQLRQLLRQVRNKDKNVYKILKRKCDALNAVDRKVAEIKNEIAALCASLERHSHRTYDPLYAAAFEHLNTRWRALTVRPAADIEQSAAQAIKRCEEVIETHLRLVAQQAAEDSAQRRARELEQREHEAAQAAAQAAAFAQAEAEAHVREAAAAIHGAEVRELAEKRAAEERLFRQIGGLIRMADAALREGGTQRASGLRRAIEEKLPSAPTLPSSLSRQLQQLDEKLNELKQWKDYAVAPKRLELIAQMQALIGSTEAPKALADRIKGLQQEWRTISRGIASEVPEEWERFQQASQLAYQPCREHFEAQAMLRQLNLEERKVVLERLLAFETTQHADNPDWRLVASVVAEAPREWRRYFPVEREAGRAIQEKFDESLGRLQAKLDAWYERNVADKQSLIKRAGYLLTQEDSREAIDAVKRLQLLWKDTGPAPGVQSQSLWNEFREVCDSVYEKRQQAYAEYAGGLEANKVKAASLCEEVEGVAALSGVPLLEGAAKIAEWRTAFDALGEMPRTEARALQVRFERAIDRCKGQVAQQRARDAEQSFTNLFEAARSINAYEWAVLQGAEPDDQETPKQAAESFIANVLQWPKGGLKAIKESVARVESIAMVDYEAREKELRILCVRVEIHSETSTPAEDEALRREYQVQRLMRGIGQGSSADDGDWDAIALEWIRIGAIEPDLHDRLKERFLRSWKRRQ
jgi:hypothetical protein